MGVMRHRHARFALRVFGSLFAFAGAAGAAELNLLCSLPSAWCDDLAAAFTRETGTQVSVTQKAAADALTHLAAQKVPRYDIWYAGAGDLHMQAAEQGLSDAYESPRLPQLREWSRAYAEQSKFRSVALYQRAVGLVVNTKRLADRKLPVPKCWEDVALPQYDDQLQMGHPDQAASSRATIVALTQLFGEPRAMAILKRIHVNVAAYARRATNAARAVARGDVPMAVAFLYDGANEVAAGFPVQLVAPCEGMAFDVVAMSLMRDAPSAADARRFYDWALGPASLEIQYRHAYWQMPAHHDAKLPASVWNTDGAKLLPNDYARMPLAERRRLLSVWDREVGVLPR